MCEVPQVRCAVLLLVSMCCVVSAMYTPCGRPRVVVVGALPEGNGYAKKSRCVDIVGRKAGCTD